MINQISKNIWQFSFEQFGSCVYLLKLNKNILIDTSTIENRSELIQDLSSLKLKPENIDIILLTHNHYDHTGNLDLFPKAEVYSEKNINKFKIKDIKVIKTPGHSEDGLSFLYHDILFSGDTIFHEGGRGRTDLPGGNEEQILKSIAKLSKIKYKILCPGHI